MNHVLGSILAASVLLPATARAANDAEASPTGKGITGGALLGAEAVMLTEAVAGVKPAWAYAVGGGIGAIGGGVGGYFAEQGGDAKLSLYLLMGGMALALPTTVAVLSTTAYEPTNYTEDRPADADEPVAEPAQPAPPPATTPAPAPSGMNRTRGTFRRTRVDYAFRVPPALFGLGGGALTLSVPAVEVRHMYTRLEVATLGVKQRAELAVPVFNVAF